MNCAKIKRIVFDKYKNKCAICNSIVGSKTGRSLIIHHIDGEMRKEYENRGLAEKNNELDNLLLVCNSCHSQLHTLAKIDMSIGEALTNTRDNTINNLYDQKILIEELSLIFRLSFAQIWKIINRK